MLRIAVFAMATVAAVSALRMPGPLPWQALPLTGGGTLGFVEWRFEPKHQLLLEVPGVCRLYSAAFAPGDATLFHAHRRPTAYVCLAHRSGDAVTNEVAAIEEATVEVGKGGGNQKGCLEPPAALAVAEGVHFVAAHSKQRPLVHRLSAAATNIARTAFLGVESHMSPPLRSSPPDGRAPSPMVASKAAGSSARWQLLEATDAFVVVGVALLPGEAVRLNGGQMDAWGAVRRLRGGAARRCVRFESPRRRRPEWRPCRGRRARGERGGAVGMVRGGEGAGTTPRPAGHRFKRQRRKCTGGASWSGSGSGILRHDSQL